MGQPTTVLIYVLTKLDTGEIRYIGRTRNIWRP